MSQHLNPNGSELQKRLTATKTKGTYADAEQRINVAGVGGIVSAAYEQLRNATEYTQEHLLRQRAIRRFYARNLVFYSRKQIKPAIADELIIELTQAGYIRNNSQPISISTSLHAVMLKHYDNFWRIREAGVKQDYAQSLTLDLLSVESETLIAEDTVQSAFTSFAYRHYLSVLQKDSFPNDDHNSDDPLPDLYENSLYIAVHKALNKSDLANIRYDLQRLQNLSDYDIDAYIRYYATIDTMFNSKQTDKIARHISRYGAPLRILKSMAESGFDTDSLLPYKEHFLPAFQSRVMASYAEAAKRLDKGVIKSIVFLLITKAIVGLAIEIPYDLLISGVVAIVPLAINLLTPIIYMALVRSGLKLPGTNNTVAIMVYAEIMLYGSGGRELYSTPKKTRYSAGFRVAYALMFIIVFGAVTAQLVAVHFNMVQGLVFFIFLGTASFLGFRLSRIVRELELVTARPSAISAIRDFLFMPFILLGQWLTNKYARINIIGLVLDTVIELPLKTILRLVRQWTDFISEKKEEI